MKILSTTTFDTNDAGIDKVVLDICDEYGAELIEKIKSNTSTEDEFLTLIADYQLKSYTFEEKKNDLPNMLLRLTRLATLYSRLEEYENTILCLDNLIRLLSEHKEYMSDSNHAALLRRKALVYINIYSYGESEKCLKEALELLKKSAEKEPIEIISVYRDMTKLYYEGERYDDAAVYGDMTLKGMQQLGYIDSKELLNDMHMLEMIYCELGAFDKAEKLVMERVGLVSNKEGHRAIDLMVVYNHVSLIYKSKRDYRKQVEWLEMSIKLEESLSDIHTSSLADSLLNLGEACCLWGEESCDNKILLTAKKILLRAAYIYKERDSLERYSSSDIAKWAATHLYLSNICALLKDYKKALSFVETADIIFDANKNIENKICCYNSYALIYDDMKSYDKAIEYFNKALELMDKDDMSRHIIYGNIGHCYQNCCDFEKMLDYMTRAYDVSFGLLDKDDHHRAKVYSNLGDAYLEIGDYKRAKGYFDEALYIYEQRGEDSITLASYLSAMGYITLLNKEYEKSIDYIKRALEIRLKIEGEISLLSANSYSYLGQNYIHIDRLTEARELLFKAFDIRKSLLGSEPSLEMASSYYSIGELLIHEGNYDEAIQYLVNSIALYTKLYSDQHTYIARSLHSLGEAYKLSGDIVKSEHSLNAALAIRSKFLRESHPDLVATRESLAIINLNV